MESKNLFTVTINARDLDCVKDTVEVVKNHVCENGMDEYSDKILKALLGEDYNKQYLIDGNNEI